MADKLTRADVVAKGHELKRWGMWGPDDEYGATNFIEPEDIVAAAKLIRKGKVFALGVTHGEIFYLKELADDCAEDGVYEFFLCAPPLNITKGTGSPINPNAIK